MTLLRNSDPAFMTADEAARRHGYRAEAELALRHACEAFARQRWPDARLCHEMVMGERKVRADMVAIGCDHIAAFEVKGEYDDTTRLLHQVGMYQLCVPEVWMVVPIGKHACDARLIRHLLPSVGLLVGSGQSAMHSHYFDGQDFGLVVEAEAAPRPVAKTMMLEMMWAAELQAMCGRLKVGTWRGRAPARAVMIKRLIDLPVTELQRECCTELRGRDALWRADPPERRNLLTVALEA